MELSEVETRVKEAIARVLKLDVAAVKDESNFIFDLGADSAQSLELVAAFEEEFDVEMDADEAMAVQSVGDAVRFIATIVNV